MKNGKSGFIERRNCVRDKRQNNTLKGSRNSCGVCAIFLFNMLFRTDMKHTHALSISHSDTPHGHGATGGPTSGKSLGASESNFTWYCAFSGTGRCKETDLWLQYLDEKTVQGHRPQQSSLTFSNLFRTPETAQRSVEFLTTPPLLFRHA